MPARSPAVCRRLGTHCARVLGDQRWLDRPSYRLEHALTLAFAAAGRHRDHIANLLHGRWLGHPLHPALTSLPTGAIGTAVLLDAARVLAGDRARWREASHAAVGVGLLASLGAAATGVTDWQHTHEQARRIGLVHGVLNSAATSLYALSWVDRSRGRQRRAIAGTAMGYGITLASGYLGAALVYGFGIGVDRSGPRLPSTPWTPVLPASALDGRPRRVEVAGVGLIVYRNDGRVGAVGERCPHLGAPMSDGWMDRDRIVCPWHGSRFACGSGEVLRGPATAGLPSYPARIRAGMVEVRGTGAPR